LHTVADVSSKRGGLIGETYQLNATHLAYCSNDKVVPFVWANKTAPTGALRFLVLTGMTPSGDPILSSSVDTLLDYKFVGYQAFVSASQITYFGCELNATVSTATITGTNSLYLFASSNTNG
jgi:hypothetical protein